MEHPVHIVDENNIRAPKMLNNFCCTDKKYYNF